MTFWTGRRVLVTGGAGFLGGALVRTLEARRAAEGLLPRSPAYELREKDAVRRCLEVSRPDVLIHAAAVVGGIGANRLHPGRFFYDNAVMGVLLVEEARRAGVAKFVGIGTVCAYPK